jgi:hypothetical protein
MLRYFALGFLLFISLADCFSQRSLLMLQKKNKNKTVYYKAGDVISFKIIGNKFKTKGEIVELKDSVIVFKGYEVPINKIFCLYIDEKTRWWLRYKIAQLSLIAGTGYLGLDVINTGELKKETLIVSVTVIGVGLLGKALDKQQDQDKGKDKVENFEIVITDMN